MIRRKLVTGFLIAMLSISSLTPAFAGTDYVQNTNTLYAKEQTEAKINKDKAKEISIKKIKDTFNVDVLNKQLECNIDFQPDIVYGNYGWYVNFSKYDEKENLNYSVLVDSKDGSIKLLGKSETTNTAIEVKNPIGKEKAKEIAEKYIKSINEEEFKNTKPDSYIESTNEENQDYYFSYSRNINGVNFNTDYINVTVDKSGKIIGYSYGWHKDIKFPSIDNVITKEKAMEIMKQNVDMKLTYIPYIPDINSGKIEGAKLVYYPEYPNGSIVNAKDGKISDYAIDTYKNQKTKDIDNAKKEEISKNDKEITKSSRDLTKDEATKIANEKIKEFYNIDKINEINLEDNYVEANKKMWVASFGKKEADGSFADGGYVNLDISNGKIIDINKFTNDIKENEIFTPKLTWEQAYDKAINTIGKYYPEKIKEIKTSQVYQDMTYKADGKDIPVRYVSFYFPRIANNINYDANGISISIDIKSGQVTSLGCKWDNSIKFPSASTIINKEVAKNTFLNANETELNYTLINTDANNSSKFEIKPMYLLKQKNPASVVYNIDAISGKTLDYNGQ